MLKRTGALLLTLLYVVTASGFVINMHYCGRLLVSVQINAPAKKCPGESHMKACNDKHFAVKIKDAHQTAAFSFSPNTFVFEVSPVAFADYSFTQQCYLAEKLLGRAPPDISPGNTPLFVKNNTFRI